MGIKVIISGYPSGETSSHVFVNLCKVEFRRERYATTAEVQILGELTYRVIEG
jgi:hypothetical protein